MLLSAYHRPPILVFLLVALTLADCHTPFGIYHTVKKGETLSAIADTYEVSTKTLKEVNYLRDADILHPGQQLFIPGAAKVKRIIRPQAGYKKQTKGPRKKATKSKSGYLARQNAMLSERSLEGVPRDKIKWTWPVEGVLTSGFGLRRGQMHTGIDIAAPLGTPITAAASGKVIYSDNKQRGYGNLIIIEHDSGFFSLYAHNKVNLVHENDRVRQGQVIARIGMSGRTTGAHLHFEIRYHKKPVDPLKLLP